MPYRVRHRSKFSETYRHYPLNKPVPKVNTTVVQQTQQMDEFDKEYEEFVKKLKAKKKTRRKKHVDDQSDQQSETDLKV